MRLETRTFVFVAVDRIAGQARHGRARRSGAGIAGPRERRRRGSAGAKPPGFYVRGAPRARPPERSGDCGAPRAKARGVRGGEAPRIWPGAPRARPPERSGDCGAPRAKARGVRGGEAPRIWFEYFLHICQRTVQASLNRETPGGNSRDADVIRTCPFAADFR